MPWIAGQSRCMKQVLATPDKSYMKAFSIGTVLSFYIIYYYYISNMTYVETRYSQCLCTIYILECACRKRTVHACKHRGLPLIIQRESSFVLILIITHILRRRQHLHAADLDRE